MTKFELSNGQAIELTKDGILIRGNRIEIDGNVTILKNDKHANIVEEDDEEIKISIVNIDDEPIKTTVNLDTEAIQKLIKKAIQNAQHMRGVIENVSKQPHVRIEFDHINDVPDIFIDGKKVTEGLVSLNVDWKTNTESISEKSFEIKLVNKDGYETTTGENSLF
jgi:hypothetical protein